MFRRISPPPINGRRRPERTRCRERSGENDPRSGGGRGSRGEDTLDDGGVGRDDGRPLMEHVGSDVGRDIGVAGSSPLETVKVLETDREPVAEKPRQSLAGGWEVRRADEDDAAVGSGVAGSVHIAMGECDRRRNRRGTPRTARGRHPDWMDGAVDIGRRGVATKRGSGACVLPRQPRSGKDHDLWRLILCEALLSATGDRQTNTTIVRHARTMYAYAIIFVSTNK